MSADGISWGMCAAYGCPLFGVYGSGGKWFCFCHANAGHDRNDAITAELHRLRVVVNASLDIRRFYGTSDWETVLIGIEKSLTAQGRADLMLGPADESPYRRGRPIVQQWLARLERVLTDACTEVGRQQPLTAGGVVGATDALDHYSEVQQ